MVTTTHFLLLKVFFYVTEKNWLLGHEYLSTMLLLKSFLNCSNSLFPSYWNSFPYWVPYVDKSSRGFNFDWLKCFVSRWFNFLAEGSPKYLVCIEFCGSRDFRNVSTLDFRQYPYYKEIFGEELRRNCWIKNVKSNKVYASQWSFWKCWTNP